MDGVVGGWASWVVGIKEDTCDQHQVLCISDGSLNSTREINIALHVK